MSGSTAIPPTATAMTSKFSAKPAKSKIVKLALPSALLTRFPSESIATSTPLASSTPSDHVNEASPAVDGSESNAASTPAATAGNLLAPPASGSKRKGVPGPKPGLKRTPSQLELNGAPKPRGKPGPKKKARVGENGEVLNGTAAPAAPKLGPKANQGAINACLRALDRTGKPTRKWQRTGFKVRSFTGYAWNAGTYAAGKKPTEEFAGDVKSDSSSSGDVKPTQESSVVASNSGPDTETPVPTVGITSSPAPFIAVNPAAA